MGRPLSVTKGFKISSSDLNALYDLYVQYDKEDWCQKLCRALILRSDGMTYKELKAKYDTSQSSVSKIVEIYLQDGIVGVREYLEQLKKSKVAEGQQNIQYDRYKKALKSVYGVELLERNKRYYMLDGSVILITDKLYYDEIMPTRELLAQERDVLVEKVTVVET